MNIQTMDLIKARVIAFAYEAGTLALSAILGVLMSPEFATVVQNNFGTGITASFILLVITGFVKHIRNVQVLNASAVGGSRHGETTRVVLI